MAFNLMQNRTRFEELQKQYKEIFNTMVEEGKRSTHTTEEILAYAQKMGKVVDELLDLEEAYRDYLMAHSKEWEERAMRHEQKLAQIDITHLAPGESAFTVYWKDGHKTFMKGTAIEDAFSRAGYGAGAVSAVDWYENGLTNSHVWDPNTKEWV